MNKPLVCYHDSCADGFCAAWCAWKRFGDKAEYLPVQYGENPPYDTIAGREVYILDFSWKRLQMEAIIQRAASLVVLDHHATAKEELTGLSQQKGIILFDMNHSGARLAWEFFHPGVSIPWLVDYTEDRDLWRWKLPHSREISAAIASYPFDFSLWDSWDQDDSASVPHWLSKEGKAILRYQKQQVDNQCKNAQEINLDGHKILAVNATMLISEITGKLAKGKPFGATYFYNKDGKKVWSLRSTPEGLDVSVIARQHGGGGHRHAAGFTE